jgi:hypothetical protein
MSGYVRTVVRGNPPGEPPLTVTSELLWRLAVRLFRDHSAELATHDEAVHCARCRQRWPCSGRRLAELGLTAAEP